MPQATDELRAEWTGEHSDFDAMKHLERSGFTLLRCWGWRKPYPAYQLTDRDLSAVCYLADEWDYEGVVDDRFIPPMYDRARLRAAPAASDDPLTKAKGIAAA